MKETFTDDVLKNSPTGILIDYRKTDGLEVSCFVLLSLNKC